MTRRLFVLALAVLAALAACPVPAEARDYHRVVILSDVHYQPPQSGEDLKLKTVGDVNSWPDVDLVAVTGDIVARYGTPEEYARAAAFVGRIAKPRVLMAGNHEYMYDDGPSGNRKFPWGTSEMRREKLARFRTILGAPELHSAKTLGRALLVFLSVDETDGRNLTQMSAAELDWLEKTLAANRDRPTLVFFHAPLKGTLEPYSERINAKSFVAQPEERIRAILEANPQVKAWVSGHTHTPPTNSSWAAPVNLYRGRVLDIHNADMNRETIWSNSLYLYPDRIEIRTWDHREGRWLEQFDRVLGM